MKFKTKIKPTLSLLNVLVFSLVMVIGVAYIAEVNRSSSKGFEMKDLQKRIDTLSVQNQQLEYQVAEKESVDHVTTHLKMLGMVPVDHVAYTSGAGSSVAVNR